MALLDHLLIRSAPSAAREQPDLSPFWRAQRGTRVLRADGQRWDLTKRDAGNRIAVLRQQWQADAWDYRDMIGELRYAQRLLARSVTRVRFFAAELRDYPEGPAELSGTDHDLDTQLAADAVANLSRLPMDDGPDGFIAALTENIETAGECWVHGEPQGRSDELWTVRSISEITSAGDQVMLSELPNNALSGQRMIGQDEELLRCWVRHPRWGQLADGPLRAMLDVLEEIVLTGREMRAASRSRIAANGVLLIPDELSLLRPRGDEEAEATFAALDDDFLNDFTQDMIAPIRNEGDAGAVVPLILRGPAEHLKEVRQVVLQRDDASKLEARLSGAVLRMLKGLDIQPEQVQGMGASNHWTAWLIEAKDVRQQVEPTSAIVASCLTKAFLRPALLALGHDPEQVRRVIVANDVSDLVENPDRSADAKDAWDRDAITDEALREALGFDADDAPDGHQHLARLLAKGRLTPEAVPLIAALEGMDMTDAVLQQALRISIGMAAKPNPGQLGVGGQNTPPSGNANPAAPGQRVPDQPIPATQAAQVVASGPPDPLEGWTVDVDTARELAAIDAALVERIVTAADAAIARVIERAGGRARNAVRKDKTLAAKVAEVDTVRVAAALGAETLLAYASLPDLLAETYDRLKSQVSRWLADAAEQAARVTLRLLKLDRRSPRGREVFEQVTTLLEPHRDAAVSALVESMTSAAERALFRADPLAPLPDQRGEQFDTLVSPSEVMAAVRMAGGGQPGDQGGLGTGPVITDALESQGALLLGHEWQYHPERSRNTFPPHLALDQARFTTFTDPKLRPDLRAAWVGPFLHPGDHLGCRCSTSPIVAVPEAGADLSRLREPTDPLQRALAESDTAAGRQGTSAQRQVEVRDRLTRAVIERAA